MKASCEAGTKASCEAGMKGSLHGQSVRDFPAKESGWKKNKKTFPLSLVSPETTPYHNIQV